MNKDKLPVLSIREILELSADEYDIDQIEGMLTSLIYQARQDTAREWLRFAEKCLEYAQHGDYSSGIEAFGIDEGRVRVKELLDKLEYDLQALKTKFLEV